MKPFIRVITIIVALTFIPAGSTIAQNAVNTSGSEPVSGYDEISVTNSSDALVQLRTALSATTRQLGGGKVLVIPTAQIQPQEIATLMEDMAVMCRIFDKKLAQSNLILGMPPWAKVTFSRPFLLDSGSMGAMYVQGYGALFMTTVDFPLSPPPKTEEKKETEEENADQVWEQEKQEMFSPQEAARRMPDSPEEKYDPDKVENLKTTLIKALVHATNIRGLKPEESVILTVTGSGISSNADKVVAISGTDQVVVHYKDKNVTTILKSPSLIDLGISSPTVLVIRAKKSYIDALAQNKIDFDEFEQKVQLISYPSLGQNISGRSSPSFWSAGATGYTLPSSSPAEGLYGGRSSNRRRDRSSDIDEMGQSSSGRRARR